jgi:hypothetical protein
MKKQSNEIGCLIAKERAKIRLLGMTSEDSENRLCVKRRFIKFEKCHFYGYRICEMLMKPRLIV